MTSGNPDWMKRAACRDLPAAIFYDDIEGRLPGRGHKLVDDPAVRRAVAICCKCPVREECLELALEIPDQFGIWGGLLPSQRVEMRQARARARLAS